MATMEQRLIAIATAMGNDIKTARLARGELSALSTTAKTNLVESINEIYGMLASAGVSINDTAGDGDSDVTWSANKIFDTIESAKQALKNELVNGAAAALDTFSELSAALGNDPNFASTIATGLGSRLRFDAAQTLTALQKTQACANLGIGEPDTDFLAVYNAAKV